MKKLALALTSLLVFASCSSGTSTADTPPTVTGAYSGPYTSNNDRDKGTMRLNLADDSAGNVSGTFIVAFDTDNKSCLINSTVTGTVTGFNVQLTIPQGSDTLTMQLTAVGNSLGGSYVYTRSALTGCSNDSGAGTVNLSR